MHRINKLIQNFNIIRSSIVDATTIRGMYDFYPGDFIVNGNCDLEFVN